METSQELTIKIDRQTFRALVLLSVAYFVQATTALCVVGGFASISSEWHLTTTESAMLVSAFGATFAVTAPLLQMLVGHWIRRTQILVGLSVMAFGALGFALAPGYPVLFAARIVMGLGAALISPILAALGSSMVKPAQQGAALATILMGLGISAVIGVPSSAWIALHVGPRWMFAIIAALTLVTAFLISFFIRNQSPGERVSPRQVLALLQRPATIGALLTAFFITAGIFSTYTMLSPILHDRYHASPHLISIAFLVYGISGLVGNLFVRRISAAWSAETLLQGSTVALIAVFTTLLILPISLTVLLAALIAWPFVLDIFWPSQQRRIVELEPAFRGLALAITASFLFTGIAAGSALGGAFYPILGFSSVLMTSIALLSIGLGALSFSVRAMKPKSTATKTGLALAALTLIGFGGEAVMAKSSSQNEKKAMVRELLKSLETRDQKPLSYINRNRFVQHDPNVEDGIKGMRKFFARLPNDTKVNTVRVFADGEYVVAHSDYDLSGPKVGFDIFRFENGKIVEHWDNLEEKCPQPNGSGRTQTDGPAAAVDLEATEANKALLKEYFEVVVIGEKRDQASKYRGSGFHQHNCYGEDDKSGFQTKKGPFGNPGFVYKVHKVHEILGEGSFVLVVNEGLFDNKPTTFYDFYRVADGKIVEHWDVLEPSIPKEQWKNANGKF